MSRRHDNVWRGSARPLSAYGGDPANHGGTATGRLPYPRDVERREERTCERAFDDARRKTAGLFAVTDRPKAGQLMTRWRGMAMGRPADEAAAYSSAVMRRWIPDFERRSKRAFIIVEGGRHAGSFSRSWMKRRSRTVCA